MAMLSHVGSRAPAVELRLEHEAKLVELLGDAAGRRLEASGVLTQDRREAEGFEDIAYDPGSDRFFALIEGLPAGPGTYQAKVHQFDGSLRYLRSDWLDFSLPDANKGMEGLTCLRRDGRTC